MAQTAQVDLHEEILRWADEHEKARRARFAAVKTPAELKLLQDDLRNRFFHLIGGLPTTRKPIEIKVMGEFNELDYTVRRVIFESLPGYFVPAVVYLPKNRKEPLPAIVSPCGHSRNGKAHPEYQILHGNLAKRGFVVLCHDPVGQGERSQFWNSENKRSKYNLGCGEHAVLGSALELLGMSLARYRIWDAMRAIDALLTLPEVDSSRIGCVGNSGGGTLTSYTTALDDRIKAAAIGCYITTLPRRMGNRIQMDPSSDPEQDIHGFVSNGIDHAGLLALCAPRPTLICSATLDFFPVEGARESFAEARHLYQVAGASEKIAKVEAENRHSLSRPLREAVYGWFAHWLAGEPGMKPSPEIEIKPRPDSDLQVCPDGQVSVSFRSRNLLDVAVEEFQSTKKPKKMSIREILKPDLTNANPLIAERGATLKNGQPMIIFINGNEGSDWRNAIGFVKKLHENGFGTVLIEPRGMGSRKRPELNRNLNYTDPVSSIEANVGYNASLVGKSLIGLRVADTLAAIDMMTREYNPSKILLCGSGDAALVYRTTILAAAGPDRH
ncbi:MAG: alpha/beta hydrolase family protein, partial [bacterium]